MLRCEVSGCIVRCLYDRRKTHLRNFRRYVTVTVALLSPSALLELASSLKQCRSLAWDAAVD